MPIGEIKQARLNRKVSRLTSIFSHRSAGAAVGGLVFCLSTANNKTVGMGEQARLTFARLDQMLADQGSDRNQLIQATACLADLSLEPEFSSAWQAWIGDDPAKWPMLATVGAALSPGVLCEVILTGRQILPTAPDGNHQSLEINDKERNMTSFIKGIDHIDIIVEDVQKAADFYRSVGFADIVDETFTGNGVQLRFPGEGKQPILELYPTVSSKGDIRPVGLAHIALAVEDLASAERKLNQAGLSFDGEPRRIVASGRLLANLIEPEGRKLQLVEVK